MKILPLLKIGKLRPKFPLIQGGMAIRVSTGELAGAVAREGGIGLIAGSGTDADDVRAQIRVARKIANGGIVGINTMVAASCFTSVMRAAVEEGIDLLVAGAGFSKDLFELGRANDVPVVPIVSSGRVAKLSEKLGASAVIVEGSEAGGHIGSDRLAREIYPEVKDSVDIPVILAGGIYTQEDLISGFEFGADGIQVGTRFAASFEANVTEPFYQTYLKAEKGDVFRVNSPVGLPGNSLPTPFTDNVDELGDDRVKNCRGCLKKCSRRFCIIQALIEASKGNLDQGLVFAGEGVYKIKEILSVKDIFHLFFDGLEPKE